MQWQHFVFLLVSRAFTSVLARPGIKYRAAVVELTSERVLPGSVTTRDHARTVMLRNVAAADAWAAKASEQGAQIVVFPEDFADSGWSLTAQSAPLFTETWPDPGPTSLCTEATAPVARALACTARKHRIVLVIGTADTGPCASHLSPFTKKPFPCHKATNLTYFNSQVAIGSNGELLAKYHKSHLARDYGKEFEAQWAEVDVPEVVSFESHFGVRFGMFICNDINFGGPTRALLKKGIRDFVFSTFWINLPLSDQAVAMQDSFSRLYAANFLASNQDYEGKGASGSGIWPANLSSDFPQYYNSGAHQGKGWMGIADLISPTPNGADIPPPVEPPKNMKRTYHDEGTWNAAYFDAAQQHTVHLNVSIEGVSCKLDAQVERGQGTYQLMAVSGLMAGWYVGQCYVRVCYPTSNLTRVSCEYVPTGSIPGGGAVFSKLTLQISALHSNTFHHSALCSNGLVVRPRSALRLQRQSATERTLELSTDCELLTAFFDSRAESELETAECPAEGCPEVVQHGNKAEAISSKASDPSTAISSKASETALVV